MIRRFLFIVMLLSSARGYAEEAELKVFVSNSMPIVSVRQYFLDSGKFGAVLVLKGLPNGSFKDLQQFLLNLDNDYAAKGNMVIDEEAFQKFNLTEVPAIVLSKGEKYDKVLGNISIEEGLRLIAKDGELSAEAKQLLKKLR